jgi:PAT family beta-lactamase induction signal transducer AmpG
VIGRISIGPSSVARCYRPGIPTKKVAVVGLLGFSSGLPYLATSQTLGAWMSAEGVDLKTIGAFSLVALPYTFKFAWAPLLDRYRLPFLGRRRGWLVVLQLGLVAALAAMGTIDPVAAPGALAVLAVAVALLSASQDVVVDAYCADVLRGDERARGTGLYVTGYKAAMVVAGAGALALADHVVWPAIYGGLAALMGLAVVVTVIADEPAEAEARPPTLFEAVWRPLAALLRQPGIVVVLAFVALYRLGEIFVIQLAVPFLKTGVGFTFAEIAALYQVLGLSGTLVGGLLGGAAVARLGLRRALIVGGLLQAATNLLWTLLAVSGPSLPLLAVVVVVDNVTSALAVSGFLAFLMSRCEPAFSATQYALLTSLSGLLARFLGVVAASIAAESWALFWAASAAVVLPALLLAARLPLDADRPTR